ncbi:unnamed protein product [Dicrocoelium dendriticum]|nr:unnamed protein product [Dicrocoelium dendriticum]
MTRIFHLLSRSGDVTPIARSSEDIGSLSPPSTARDNVSVTGSETSETYTYEPTARLEMLLDLGQYASSFSIADLPDSCVSLCEQMLAQGNVSYRLSYEFQLDMLTLRVNAIKESHPVQYNRSEYIEVHRKFAQICYQRLCEAMKNGVSNEAAHVGCVTLWNLCLPLMNKPKQSDGILLKSLQLISDTLDKSKSLHYRLHCQTHWVLAQCLAEVERTPQALMHLEKSLKYDERSEFTEGIVHLYNRLQLRANLYGTQTRAEDTVGQILEHLRCVELSDFRASKFHQLFQLAFGAGAVKLSEITSAQDCVRSILIKAGELLAPNRFSHAVEMERSLVASISDTTPRQGGSGRKTNQDDLLSKIILNQESVHRLASRADTWKELAAMFVHPPPQPERANGEVDVGYNVKERVLLWKDLADAARRFQLWDVCRLSCRFGLEYHQEDRWSAVFAKMERGKSVKTKESLGAPKAVSKEETQATNTPEIPFSLHSVITKLRASVTETTSSYADIAQALRENLTASPTLTNLELTVLRALVEINCLYAEALCVLLREQPVRTHLGRSAEQIIHDLLKSRNIESLRNNIASEDEDEANKRQLEPDHSSITKHLRIYSDWLYQISETALENFRRSVQSATKLKDVGLLRACVVCLWNHSLPAVYSSDHRQLVTTFQNALECDENLGYTALPIAVRVELTVVTANGLIQPWLPDGHLKSVLQSTSKKPGVSETKTTKVVKVPRIGAGKRSKFMVPAEGQLAVKNAAELLLKTARQVEIASGQCYPLTVQPQSEFHVMRKPPERLSLDALFRLIHIWLRTRQLNPDASTYRGIFPGDATVEPLVEERQNVTISPDKEQVADVKTVYSYSSVVRALLATQAMWISNRTSILSAWNNTMTSLSNGSQPVSAVPIFMVEQSGPEPAGFRDAPSISEAVGLMKAAFCTTEPEDISQVNQEYGSLQPTPTQDDRLVELQHWNMLSQIAVATEQYTAALEISEYAKVEEEYHKGVRTRFDYWIARLLDSRGLAIMGLAKQHREQKRTAALASSRKAHTTELTELDPIRRLDHDSELFIAAGKTLDASFFAAAEEAFLKAVEIGVRASRYNLILISAIHYWNACTCTDISTVSSAEQMLLKFPVIRKRCGQILQWLVNAVDSDSRSRLHAELRSHGHPDEEQVANPNGTTATHELKGETM